MGDDFLRLLLCRHIFASCVLRAHRSFRGRGSAFQPSSKPQLPDLDLVENPTLQRYALDLAAQLDVRHLFVDCGEVDWCQHLSRLTDRPDTGHSLSRFRGCPLHVPSSMYRRRLMSSPYPSSYSSLPLLNSPLTTSFYWINNCYPSDDDRRHRSLYSQ